jgi:flagellar basal body-associated protein FliL
MSTKLIALIVAAVLLLGAVGLIYYKGGENERNKNNAAIGAKVEKQRQGREEIENTNRNLDDDAATERLRPPKDR